MNNRRNDPGPVEIRLAGPLRFLVHGRDVTPKARKTCGLIVLLATAPKLRRTRAWLQSKLWSDRAPEQAAASLRQALHELRKCLDMERDCLLTQDDSVGFDAARVAVDLVSLERSVLPRTGPPEFAEGLDIRDPEFELWIRDKRRIYEEAYGASEPPVVFEEDTAESDEALAQTVTPPEGAEKSRRWRIGGRYALSAALIAVVLLGGLGLAAWTQRGPGVGVIEPIAREGRPSLAVLPFTSIGGEAVQAALVEGVSKDVVTDLSKFPELFVIAAHSSFQFDLAATPASIVGAELGARYVVDGSLQWLGDLVRVNVAVLDSTTGRTIWAERLDRPAEDLLAVQNEVAKLIVGAVGPVDLGSGALRQAELGRMGRLPTEDLQAYDHFLRGEEAYQQFSPAGKDAAQQAFRAALELDPDYAKARARLAWTHIQEFWNGWTSDPDAALALADRTAREALSSDPNEPQAHATLGAVRLFQRRHDDALAAYRRALELNPNDADLMMYHGWALTYAGQPEAGLRQMEEALLHNPYHPGGYLWDIAFAQLMLGEYGAAAETLERREPRSVFTHLLLAQIYAMLGREDDAAASMAVFQDLEPGYGVQTAAAFEPFRREEDRQAYLASMRQAGLPEQGALVLDQD